MCVMPVGRDVNIFKLHLCTVPTRALLRMALTELHVYLKAQWAPASVVTKVCTPTRWAEVSSRSPLCASSVQAAMWECAWLLVSDLLPVCPRRGVMRYQRDREIRTGVLASGKGWGSLERSSLPERLGCCECECAAVQGKGREEAFQ